MGRARAGNLLGRKPSEICTRALSRKGRAGSAGPEGRVIRGPPTFMSTPLVAAYSAVRTLQISGNSTTSSIFFR